MEGIDKTEHRNQGSGAPHLLQSKNQKGKQTGLQDQECQKAPVQRATIKLAQVKTGREYQEMA